VCATLTHHYKHTRWKRKIEQKQRKEAALRKEGYDIRKKESAKGNNEQRDKRILTVSALKQRLNEVEENGQSEAGKGKTAA
jgi:hypothetical protein